MMHSRGRIMAAFAAVYLVWGSTYLAIRYAVEVIPPYVLGATRFLVAGLILLAIAAWRGAPRPTRADLRTATITGVLMLALGNGAVNWSETMVASGIVALIVSTVPLWMVLVDWARPRGRRPHGLVFVGLALGLVGMLVLIGPGALTGQGGIPIRGFAILLAGSLAWAIGSVYTRQAAHPASKLMWTGLQMVAGGVAFGVIALLLGEVGDFAPAQVGTRAILALVYLTFAGSLVGFTAYIYLLGAVSAAKASTYAYVNPVIAVLLGWGFAGEDIGARTAIAAAVILTGVAIITATHGAPPPTTGEHPLPIRTDDRARPAA